MKVALPVLFFVPSVASQLTVTLCPTAMSLPMLMVFVAVKVCFAPLPTFTEALVPLKRVAVTSTVVV